MNAAFNRVVCLISWAHKFFRDSRQVRAASAPPARVKSFTRESFKQNVCCQPLSNLKDKYQHEINLRKHLRSMTSSQFESSERKTELGNALRVSQIALLFWENQKAFRPLLSHHRARINIICFVLGRVIEVVVLETRFLINSLYRNFSTISERDGTTVLDRR